MAGNYVPAKYPVGQQMQTSAGYYWQILPSQAFGELASQYAHQLHYAIVGAAKAMSPTIAAWMKENAAWKDRTGMARAGLYAEVDDVEGQYVSIIVGHSVHYGLFLEINYAGRYAIINPAIDKFSQEFWKEVQRILR